jgi:predicted anti-sigma-YlaC factor YlaD
MGAWRRTTACEHTRRWISLALDGETSELEAAAVRRHVGRCADCARLAVELGGLTERLRATPLDEPRRPLTVPAGRTRTFRRPVQRRVALAAAFAVSVASAVAVISVPSPSTLLVQSSALRFTNANEEIEFAQSKNLTLEPFLGSLGVNAFAVEVPVFSERALR